MYQGLSPWPKPSRGKNQTESMAYFQGHFIGPKALPNERYEHGRMIGVSPGMDIRSDKAKRDAVLKAVITRGAVIGALSPFRDIRK